MGPAQRIGASLMGLEGCLRLTIGVDSTNRIAASDASHRDVAFQHLRSAGGTVHGHLDELPAVPPAISTNRLTSWAVADTRAAPSRPDEPDIQGQLGP